MEDYFRTLYEKLADLKACRAEAASEGRGARAGPGERSGGPAAQTMSEATARFLREASLKSERYFEAVDRLGEDSHGAIGPAEEVQKPAQKNGRRSRAWHPPLPRRLHVTPRPRRAEFRSATPAPRAQTCVTLQARPSADSARRPSR